MKLLTWLLLVVVVVAIDEAECEKRGFSSALLCSSCDKLQAFVDNSDIVNECRSCCLEDSDDSSKQVVYAKLKLNPYFYGSYSEVNDFLNNYSKRYTNLEIINSHKVSNPHIQIGYEDNKSEIIQIGKWKSDQIRDFCDSILIKAE